MYCVKCGKEVNGKFCTNCGAAVESTIPEQNIESSNQIYKDKTGEDIDLSVVYGVYKTRPGLERFFRNFTNYSAQDARSAIDYIFENVEKKEYTLSERVQLQQQIESGFKASGANSSGKGCAGIVSIGVALILVVLIVTSLDLLPDSTTRQPEDGNVSVGADSQEPDDDAKEEPQEKEKAIEISASSLYEEYDNNPVNADEKYNGKQLIVTGNINNIGKDILDDVYVVVGSGSEYELIAVQCYFDDEEQIKLVGQLKRGDSIAIIGECTGQSLSVIMKKCKIA